MVDKSNSPKWRVLAGGFLSYMFDAVDVIILTIAMPDMMIGLHITRIQAGLLATATLLGIGLSGLLMGSLADILGRKRALLLSLLSFGFLTMAISGISDWRLIFLLRFVSGLGLGGVYSAVAAHIAEVWPQHQRGRATAFVLSSFSLGASLAAAISAYVLPMYGWQMLFFLCGASVIVPASYVWLFVPESDDWLTRKNPSRVRIDESRRGKVADLFSRDLARVTLLSTLICSLALSAYWGTVTWLPTFLVRERGLDVSTMAGFLALSHVGTFVGYNAFGLISDRIGKKLALMLSLFGVGLMLPIYALTTEKTVLLLLGPTYAFFVVFPGLAAAYLSEIFPTYIRATGAGFPFNVGRGISAVAPLLLGMVAKTFGFGISISLCGMLYVLAAIVVQLLPRNGESLCACAQVSANDLLSTSSPKTDLRSPKI
ncbi:MFS transporter [Paraburkholderia nemoris]|uniref:MFS transporter n=1 Tax=Paraburkholderia nemoris TaxID=2793076 RepID=UPI0038BABED1